MHSTRNKQQQEIKTQQIRTKTVHTNRQKYKNTRKNNEVKTLWSAKTENRLDVAARQRLTLVEHTAHAFVSSFTLCVRNSRVARSLWPCATAIFSASYIVAFLMHVFYFPECLRATCSLHIVVHLTLAYMHSPCMPNVIDFGRV